MVSKKSRSEVRVNKHRNCATASVVQAEKIMSRCKLRSNNHMYAQIIDDTIGNTLVSASTLDKGYQGRARED